MNQTEAAQAVTMLAAIWPKQFQDIEAGAIELWYRSAFRHTRIDDAQDIVDRLVGTMSYAPKPADWSRVDGEVRAEKRRQHTEIATHQQAIEPAPEVDEPTRVENIRRLRESIQAIGERKKRELGG